MMSNLCFTVQTGFSIVSVSLSFLSLCAYKSVLYCLSVDVYFCRPMHVSVVPPFAVDQSPTSVCLSDKQLSQRTGHHTDSIFYMDRDSLSMCM